MTIPNMITAASVKMRFPAFVDTPDSQIEYAIEEAQRWVDDTWLPDDQVPAMLYLSAHYLAVALMVAESGTGQIVQSERIGQLSTTFVTVTQPPNSRDLQTTVFGRRYLDLLHRNFGGGIVV
jgi:Protein of unknown function (DUF4054)